MQDPTRYGLPPYPQGDVQGPCVCGSWPGGSCRQCRVVCALPPPGWHCTRDPGHQGPCAAVPTAQAAVWPMRAPAYETNWQVIRWVAAVLAVMLVLGAWLG